MTDPDEHRARIERIERSFAKRMARRHALHEGQRTGDVNLPQTPTDAFAWEPPEWAIQALIDARTENLND